MIPLTYALLVTAFLLFSWRLGRGPSLADRVLGFDGMLVSGISLILVNALDTGRGSFLQTAVLLTLVGFIGTSVLARFIEGRGE